jgi:hypothetical protein
VRFRNFHSGVQGEKSHLDVGSVASHRVYYKGEGSGFSQVQAVVSLVCPCCPCNYALITLCELCAGPFE